MLKKLRKKIILMNVTLCSVVLLCVFTAMCVNSWQSAENELRLSLSRAMEFDGTSQGFPSIGSAPMGDAQRHPGQTASVVVTVDDGGHVAAVNENSATIDDDVLAEAVDAALASESDSGTLSSLGLMFVKHGVPGGVKIAFGDTGAALSILRRSIVVSALLFVLGTGVLFVISLWLSGMAVRPVAEAWTQQKQFVADASHELKTPLTVILANNNILLAHGDDTVSSQRQWLESTGEEAGRMKTLINRMLVLAKTDAEEAKPVLRELNLSELAEEALLYFEPVAFEKGVSIAGEIPPGVRVTGDAEMLLQLLQIVLDNAVKYAPAGTAVTVRLEKHAAAELSINNMGEPIPQEELPYIFDRFYRTDKVRTVGGSGLGLAIARNIAGALGAKLSVQSARDTGTTFKITV